MIGLGFIEGRVALEAPGPIGIVCHDAGASNIIAAWVARTGVSAHILARGPAEQSMRARRVPYSAVASLEDVVKEAAVLVTGTGWASRLEHDARSLARQHHVPSIAVLDHWVNFPERFRRDGVDILPDLFWVTDDFAEALARRHFDPSRVCRVPNFYVDEQLEKIARSREVMRSRLLYVLEPARSNWAREGEGEFQALEYFVANLAALGLPDDCEIALRPHPSETEEKYRAWCATHPKLNLVFDRSPDLAAAISVAEWVAGCESFALTLALAAGRQVFCTLPPWAPACRLPHPGLVHLKNMV